MSTTDAHVTKDDEFYCGEDKILRWVVYSSAARTAIEDMTGADLKYVALRKRGGAVLLSKTSGSPGGISLEGSFNADPAVNTQRVLVHFDAEDTDDMDAGSYWHELSRENIGSEAVLGQGRLTLLEAGHIE